MRELQVNIRKIAGWEFFNDNVEVCDVVRPGGLDALGPDDRVVVQWCISVLGNCQRLLDLGCGSGFPGLYVAPGVAEFAGVDAAPNMIAAARKNATRLGVGNAALEVGDGARLRFRDSEFDGTALTDLIASEDFGNVVLERLPVWEHGVLALTAAG